MGKKLNLELKNKLKNYSAAAGSIILSNSVVNAQINYTDIIPDLILHDMSAVYPLDIDGDLQDDFNFFAGYGTQNGTFSYGPYYGLQFIDYSNGAMAGAINSNNEFQVDSSYNNDALNFNVAINSFQQFNNFYTYLIPLAFRQTRVAQTVSFSSTSLIGVWHGKTDKYLGLRFQSNSNIHYGWIRMDVTPDCDSIIIKDYAYNTVPNQGILAGQTALSMDEVEKQISIYAYQQSLYINRVENSVSQVLVFGLDGKLVFEKSITEKNEIISLQHLPKGIYLVEVDGISKKFVF